MNLLLVVVGWEGGDGARCYGTKADVMTLHLSKHRGGRGGGRGGCVLVLFVLTHRFAGSVTSVSM